VVRRRELLLAAGATILAGCGKEQAAAEPTAREVLLRSVAAERALAFAVRLDAVVAELVGEPLRPADRVLVRRIEGRVRERAGQAAAALSAAGGRPHDAPEPEEVGDPLDRARAALEAHVAALPSLAGRDLRELGASLVEGSAADLAVLEVVLASPSGDAFPGTPA
jgi:hypothetical protein